MPPEAPPDEPDCLVGRWHVENLMEVARLGFLGEAGVPLDLAIGRVS